MDSFKNYILYGFSFAVLFFISIAILAFIGSPISYLIKIIFGETEYNWFLIVTSFLVLFLGFWPPYLCLIYCFNLFPPKSRAKPRIDTDYERGKMIKDLRDKVISVKNSLDKVLKEPENRTLKELNGLTESIKPFAADADTMVADIMQEMDRLSENMEHERESARKAQEELGEIRSLRSEQIGAIKSIILEDKLKNILASFIIGFFASALASAIFWYMTKSQ